MPPDGKLPDAVIADFEQWIAMGAPDPRDGVSKLPREIEAENHWSFQPVKAPELPAVKDADWPRDRLDHFILTKLEAENLNPVADAGRRTLIRRATLELTGLPPTPEEISAFLADPAPDPDALAEVVDRLLASDQFGPRWGRHWLDVARYGESSGYSRNMLYPYAWRYRNWVIDAFNDDKPYDQFVREQIAGDLLPADSQETREEQTLGTAFLTIGPKTFNEGQELLFRLNVADDQIDATCRAFLALTANCARCHDHKYDPIPTQDYYALAGIFQSSKNLAGSSTNVREEHVGAFPLGADGWERVKKIEEKSKAADEIQKEYLEIVKKRNEIREPLEKEGIDWKKHPTPELTAAEAEVQAFQKKVQAAKAAIPEPPEFAMAVVDAEVKTDEQWKTEVELAKTNKAVWLQPRIANSPLFEKGNHETPLEPVPRGVLSHFKDQLECPPISESESGRLQLAQWLTDPKNPLTARVYVNRVWHHLFGTGLVDTPDNFGLLGSQPSHPELLDDLADRFVSEFNWSTKQLIRTIVLSRTWMLDSAVDEKNYAADPGNRLLWRFAPQRLEGEVIRDSILAISGKFDTAMLEGSQVFNVAPQQPLPRQREIGRRDYYVKDMDPTVVYRSVYLPMARGWVFDSLKVFDPADTNLVVGARKTTTVPSQSLFLMNSPLVLEHSKQAAARLLGDRTDFSTAIPEIYETILGRPPSERETEWSLEFLKSSSQLGDFDRLPWAQLVQALFCSGEFRTIY